MSENMNNSEELEDGAKSYNLVELLNLEKELEEESAAVLGGSDDKCCTYKTGYIKRQALYSCLTCCPECKEDFNKAAGICLACSYKCHENHELIELYTKRNFRCDCPTRQIPETKCSFILPSNECCSFGNADSTKSEINLFNQYNHNFSGSYCICKRPYPDDEDPISDEMIQCIICEDWYHTRHLKSEIIPKTNEYCEMICGDCVMKNQFLKNYIGLAVNTFKKNEHSDESTNSIDTSVGFITNKVFNVEKENIEIQTSGSFEIEEDDENEQPLRKKAKLDNENTNICRKPAKIFDTYMEGAVFWPDNWRKFLCDCVDCKKIYSENKVSFLLDPEDTILVYEEKGLKKYHDTYDRAVNSLLSLGHTKKIDVITGYNHLKDKLKDFFAEFSKANKVITEVDVKEFFQKLNTERSEILNQQNQQFFCR